MLDEFLARIFSSQWLALIIVSVLLVGLAEFGFRVGSRLFHANDEARKGQIGTIHGAMLGLLGLLLGFTFAMAAGRYETRRDLVLREANAIGTTYLRASFLPEPQREAIEDLLRQYVDVRLEFYDAGEDKTKIAAALKEAARIQGELWANAAAGAKEAPTTLAPTFIISLNETIDLAAARTNARRNHVPGAVWLLVLVVAACGCAASGYSAGTSGKRGGFANFVLPLLIALVIALIADLDRPRGGIVGISQRPLQDLRTSLRSEAP